MFATLVANHYVSIHLFDVWNIALPTHIFHTQYLSFFQDIINADQSIEKEEFEQQNTSEDLEEVISETGGEYSSIPSLTSFESVLSDDEFSESDWVVV